MTLRSLKVITDLLQGAVRYAIHQLSGLRTRACARNHILYGGPDLPVGMGYFEGEGRPIVKYRDTLRSSLQKTAEPIEMPIATRQWRGGLSGWPTECRYCRYPAPKGHCHSNHFFGFLYMKCTLAPPG